MKNQKQYVSPKILITEFSFQKRKKYRTFRKHTSKETSIWHGFIDSWNIFSHLEITDELIPKKEYGFIRFFTSIDKKWAYCPLKGSESGSFACLPAVRGLPTNQAKKIRQLA